MIPRRLVVAVALAAASALALASCAAATSRGSDAGDRIAVVGSTNVYGQIAEEIGGDLVEVTSIVSTASQDPHSFEPSPRDQLAVSRADLIIENGGGYDAFVGALIEASGTTAPVVTAVEFAQDWPGAGDHDDAGETDAGDHADHEHVEGFNEHVWYDPPTMAAVAEAIASALTEIAPGDAATFDKNLAIFTDGIADIEAELAGLRDAHEGADVFVTEPVPLHLTAAAGLVNVAPEAFTQAVEEGQDVPPATLLEALKLLRDGDVRIVIVNAQTGGAETDAVIDEAESAGIPVVEFTETLPSDQTYLSWMQANVAALTKALEG